MIASDGPLFEHACHEGTVLQGFSGVPAPTKRSSRDRLEG
jgi:hypothetical protein